jgi:two-component system, NarL family, sensor kinase
MKYFVSVSLVFFTLLVQAQKEVKEQLETLKKEIRQSTYYDSVAVFTKGRKAIDLARKNGLLSEESTIYQYYGNFYFFSYNFEKAHKNYRKSIEIAKKAGDEQLVNSTRIRMAFITATSDILEGEKEFQQLLKEASKENFYVNQIEIYNGLGNIYADRMIRDTSLNYYLKGLKIAEKQGKKYHQAMMLNNIGLLKFANKQTEEAAKDFKRAVELLAGLSEERLMLNLNNNLGLVYKALEKYEESVKYYSQTVKYAGKIGFPQGRSVAYLNLADSYLRLKKTTVADQYTDSAMIILRSVQEPEYMGLAYLMKSSVHLDKNDLITARIYADSMLLLEKQFRSPSNKLEYYKQMSLIAEKKNDFKSALDFTNRYHDLKDSLAEITNSDKLAELEVIYGKERMETDLENERNKNSLLSAENDLRKARLNLFLVIFLVLLIVGVGIVYIRHIVITRKQQVYFTQKLIENTDEERSRISKDLHDDIGQSLSIIKSKLNLFNSGKITELGNLDKEVGEVIEQTRTISHNLHPSVVEKLGLERSIVSLLEKTQENTGIISSISIRKDIEALPVETKTQLYRIIQECINNTIKHAEASALKVTLVEQNGLFTVTYRDNGKGFKQEKDMQEGIGMLTIKERARSIGAKIQVEQGNKGFKLTLSFHNT